MNASAHADAIEEKHDVLVCRSAISGAPELDATTAMDDVSLSDAEEEDDEDDEEAEEAEEEGDEEEAAAEEEDTWIE